MKKALGVLFGLSLAVLLFSCTRASPQIVSVGKDNAPSEASEASGEHAEPSRILPGPGKLTVYSWNEDFKYMLENYYLKDNPLPDGMVLDYVLIRGETADYRRELESALYGGGVDIFLLEPEYARDYIDSSRTLSLTELGISEEEMRANQYPYTVDTAISIDGDIKASSWQAAPGLFVYRRSLFSEYFGMSEPGEVQQLVESWEAFTDTARILKELSGGRVKLIASKADAERVIAELSEGLNKYTELLTTLEEEELTAGKQPWGDAWNEGFVNGSIAGYFLPAWGIKWVLASLSGSTEEGGTYGDWGAVAGPQPYYWGGVWIAVSTGSPQLDIVQNIIRYFTLNYDSMLAYSLDSGDFVNNRQVIGEIIKSEEGFELLGGQNHYSLMDEVALRIGSAIKAEIDE